MRKQLVGRCVAERAIIFVGGRRCLQPLDHPARHTAAPLAHPRYSGEYCHAPGAQSGPCVGDLPLQLPASELQLGRERTFFVSLR